MRRRAGIGILMVLAAGIWPGGWLKADNPSLVPYRIPAGFENLPPHTLLYYGAYEYEIEADHTMHRIGAVIGNVRPGQPRTVADVAPGHEVHDAFGHDHYWRSSGAGFFGPGFSRDFHRY